MELGELKTLVTVAAEQSFSRAAIRLCRTQPAVSQAIRRLEEDLGERLFDRSTTYATLTQAGDALLPEAIGLRRMVDKAAATIRQLSQGHRAVLRIGGDESSAHLLLPALSTSRAVVSSPTASAGLVVIPLSAARAASARTLVYRDNDGQPRAVEDFVEAVRSTGEDRASRKAPMAVRASR